MDSFSHKKAPHWHNGRFFNFAGERKQHFFFPSLSMLIECYWNTTKKALVDRRYWFSPCEQKEVVSCDAVILTWIGHSTFLIQTAGIRILTDPVFGHLPLFRRQLPPGIPLDKLPAVDYILISHNHRDHMDEPSLSFFKKHQHTHFLVPKGDKVWFVRRGFKNVSEYTWWDQKIVSHLSLPLSFTFLPALHWSQRGVFDFNKSLWGSWMISIGDQHFYFAGDTAYSDHFLNISKEFKNIVAAMMPVGPCEPRKWMSYAHVSAEEAGQGFLDLQARQFIPMHWGTFSFGTDMHHEPIERISNWWKQQFFQDDKLLTILKVGQQTELSYSNQAIHGPFVTTTNELNP